MVARERGSDTGHRDQVVDLVQTAFSYSTIITECTWYTVILLPKGGGDSRSNRLIDFIYKTIMGMINCHIGTAIIYHDVLNGLCARRNTGNAYLESNLLQKMAEMIKEILYEVFLYLRN